MANKFYYREGNFECEILLSKTNNPTGNLSYHEPAWWAATQGRNPDIALVGPHTTRKELIVGLRQAGWPILESGK